MRDLQAFRIGQLPAVWRHAPSGYPSRGYAHLASTIIDAPCTLSSERSAGGPTGSKHRRSHPDRLAPWRASATGNRRKLRAAAQKSAQRPGAFGELAAQPVRGDTGRGEPVGSEQQGGALAAADPSAASRSTSGRIPPPPPRPSTSPPPSATPVSGRTTRTAGVSAASGRPACADEGLCGAASASRQGHERQDRGMLLYEWATSSWRACSGTACLLRPATHRQVCGWCIKAH